MPPVCLRNYNSKYDTFHKYQGYAFHEVQNIFFFHKVLYIVNTLYPTVRKTL